MIATVNYSIIGEIPPFVFSVKDENLIEKYLYTDAGKIYFNASQSNGVHKYLVTISKNNCIIKNEIVLNTCNPIPTPITTPVPSVTPVPTAIVCNTPVLSVGNIIGNSLTASVVDSGNCIGYVYQYSTTSDFAFFSTVSSSCIASKIINFPNSGTWYLRVLKNCNGSSVFSNFITVTLTNTTPTPIATPTTPRLVWNLQLCNGQNATYQVDDDNLDVGTVIKDNISGICYKVIIKGAFISTLLTSYYEIGTSCTSECN